MDKYVNARVDEIKSHYETESVEEAIGEYTTEVMLEMVRNCEKFAQETSIMYDNFYPLDTSSENRVDIANLSKRIDKATEQDTLKSLLHLRLAKLISQRDLESALTDIELIQEIDSDDVGAYLAASQIYNLQGNHKQALVQIEKAIALTGRKEYELFAEIIKRKINS